MDLHLLASVLPTTNFTRVLLPSKTPISLQLLTSGSTRGSTSSTVPSAFKCKVTNEISSNSNVVVRRSANYEPPIWHYDYIQSLRSEYAEESWIGQIEMLKEEVRIMLRKAVDPLLQLELIDNLQRLGLSYHFQSDIRVILESIYTNTSYQAGADIVCKKENLYSSALQFRLLRQHGYSIPQEIFNRFKTEFGSFEPSLCDDIKGILCLYEASFLLIEGESILEEARDFATKTLKEFVELNKDQNNLSAMVSHALELPLHWRMIRLEARWFIDLYRSGEDMNPILLELAELDFNMVQAVHQEDLKQMSRWWRSTGLGENLSFARDRLMENFLWTVGMSFQPEFGYNRRMLTKVNSLITTIDDVYDVYGTLEELELFTDAVERWDTNAMEQLPYYMQMCFLSLHNSINESAFDTLKQKGLNNVRYLKKAWVDLCKSYLLEARWYYNGYTPSFQEYIENAWISIGAPVILVHAYFSVTNSITEEALGCWEEYSNIVRWSSMILRLADDLGTSTDELERGDVPKSIQCYMNDTGASEEVAREYIRSLISTTWKNFNEERAASSPFSETFVEIAMNVARMAQCMYQHGDGHGIENHETKERVLALLIHPISLHK
ncbi:myrcene synthase, chloroplastic-like [Juglans microcarpa x Juglans regia]|uniref:myrcene synthase, chloroplastic-like n=1 Tax=Juglans microcarpa x Juglans regia TaxID=2249226 RepID=UPI001B7E3B5E|nr:myrcene synthase, chloroplastic-like [Juglans microcarpa x Juglans regia]